MRFTFEELRTKTVAQLREIARGIEHEALHGHSTMHKEHLLPVLCAVLGIEAHEHHQVKGINKGEIKAQIQKLKLERDAALDAHDHKQLKAIRRKIHHLKHGIRRATV